MEYDPKDSVLSPDTLVSQKRRAKANGTDVLSPPSQVLPNFFFSSRGRSFLPNPSVRQIAP